MTNDPTPETAEQLNDKAIAHANKATRLAYASMILAVASLAFHLAVLASKYNWFG